MRERERDITTHNSRNLPPLLPSPAGFRNWPSLAVAQPNHHRSLLARSLARNATTTTRSKLRKPSLVVTYAATNTLARNSAECRITHRKCQESLAVADLRSPPVTTKRPLSTIAHFLHQGTPIRMLHFSKLLQRSRFFFSSTHSDSSSLSHVVLPFTMAATLPTHPPLPPSTHLSRTAIRLSLQQSLSPFLFRFGHTNTDHRHAGERVRCPATSPRPRLGPVGVKLAHVFHTDIFAQVFHRTWQHVSRPWRVLLSWLFRRIRPLLSAATTAAFI